MSTVEIPQNRWQRNSGWILGCVAILISLGALGTSIFGVGYPIYSSTKSKGELITVLLNGLVSTSYTGVGDARVSTVADSEADLYVQTISHIWQADRSAGHRKFEHSAGSWSKTATEYSVCFVKLALLPKRCATFSGFHFDPDGKGIETFSIDGAPIRGLETGPSKDNRAEDPKSQLHVQLVGVIGDAAQENQTVVFYLSRDTNKSRKTMTFREDHFYAMTRDEHKIRHGSFAFPSHLARFDYAYAAVRVPVKAMGFLWVCGVLKNKETCTWVDL